MSWSGLNFLNPKPNREIYFFPEVRTELHQYFFKTELKPPNRLGSGGLFSFKSNYAHPSQGNTVQDRAAFEKQSECVDKHL